MWFIVSLVTLLSIFVLSTFWPEYRQTLYISFALDRHNYICRTGVHHRFVVKAMDGSEGGGGFRSRVASSRQYNVLVRVIFARNKNQ